MAATVVSVVLFLCGVLVGRGVRTAQETQASQVAVKESFVTADTMVPSIDSSAALLDESADPRVAAPPMAVAEVGDTIPVEKPVQPLEQPKPPANKPTPLPAATAPPAPVAPAATRVASNTAKPAPTVARETSPPSPAAPAATTVAANTAKPAATVAREPSPPAPAAPAATTVASNTAKPAATVARETSPPSSTAASRQGDWTVQVAALNVRSDADQIAKRLASKGYSSFVVSPPNGNQKVFRVRVGPFPTRREADVMAARLQKEEQFKPWVTR